MIVLICEILLTIFLTSGCVWCYFQEKKHFNNGICPKCGKSLMHFDDDSQGGQGWYCRKCDYYVWISWFKR